MRGLGNGNGICFLRGSHITGNDNCGSFSFKLRDIECCPDIWFTSKDAIRERNWHFARLVVNITHANELKNQSVGNETFIKNHSCEDLYSSIKIKIRPSLLTNQLLGLLAVIRSSFPFLEFKDLGLDVFDSRASTGSHCLHCNQCACVDVFDTEVMDGRRGCFPFVLFLGTIFKSEIVPSGWRPWNNVCA